VIAVTESRILLAPLLRHQPLALVIGEVAAAASDTSRLGAPT